MSSGERLIADSRAFAAGMEEERQQILTILMHRRSEFLDVLFQFGEERTSWELLELNNLIFLLEKRGQKGS